MPWYGFGITLRELRQGKPPHIATLVEALEGDAPIPREVRKFLADFLAHRVKMPRSRPTVKNDVEHAIDQNFLRQHYEFEKKRAGDFLAGTPSEIAVATTTKNAAQHGIRLAEDTIRSRVQRKAKKKRTTKKLLKTAKQTKTKAKKKP